MILVLGVKEQGWAMGRGFYNIGVGIKLVYLGEQLFRVLKLFVSASDRNSHESICWTERNKPGAAANE